MRRINQELMHKLLSQKVPQAEVAKKLGISRTTLYRYLNKIQQDTRESDTLMEHKTDKVPLVENEIPLVENIQSKDKDKLKEKKKKRDKSLSQKEKFVLTNEMRNFCMMNSRTKDPELMFNIFRDSQQDINIYNIYKRWENFCMNDKYGKNYYQK